MDEKMFPNVETRFSRLETGVSPYETKYFKQMRKDNVILLKIKWL